LGLERQEERGRRSGKRSEENPCASIPAARMFEGGGTLKLEPKQSEVKRKPRTTKKKRVKGLGTGMSFQEN